MKTCPARVPENLGTGKHRKIYQGKYIPRATEGAVTGVWACGKLLHMKALVITKLGGPTEVLEVKDSPAPAAGAGEELVAVQAGGMNFADVMTAEGGYPGDPQAATGCGTRVLWPSQERRPTRDGLRAVGRFRGNRGGAL